MNGSLTLVKAAENQLRAAVLAGVLILGAVWVTAALGKWQVGIFVSAGIALGWVNQVFTELTLLRSLDREGSLSRREFAVTSLLRLALVTVIAVILMIVFWPDGATVLLGLALFHLIVLVLTGFPLLKELRKA